MNVLVFAPHPDDEILGCGGTIAKHIKGGDDVFVCVVTKGKEPLFPSSAVETTREEQKLSHTFLGIKKTIYLDFPAAEIESIPRHKLNDAIKKTIFDLKPSIVYMPHHGDMQKDHELIADSIMVAIRPRGDISVKKVYSYETLSETEWNVPYPQKSFIPQRYVDISDFIDLKIKALSFFKSQLRPFPFARSLEAIDYLSRVRGSTISVNAAEAFMVIREIE